MPGRTHPGFTLIELLVVITIIVVLLALLTPALEKAVYQAQLAVCGADMHGLGAGLLTYAAAHQRRYPYRPAVHATEWSNTQLAYGGVPEWDTRPLLRPYISVNGNLNCPLLKVDLEGLNSHVFATHNLWAGMQYRTADGGQGMLRVGDRWEWNDQPLGYRLKSNLLGGARLAYFETQRYVNASHPGEDYYSLQSQDGPGVLADLGGGTTVNNGNTYTWAGWYSKDANPGPVDLNNLFDDGSAARYDRVECRGDKRMARVPLYSDGVRGWPLEYWELVPKR